MSKEETKAEIAASRAKGQLLYSNEHRRAERLAEKLSEMRLRAFNAEQYADLCVDNLVAMRARRNDWRAASVSMFACGVLIGAILMSVFG